MCSICGRIRGNMNQLKVAGATKSAQNQLGQCLMEEIFNGFVLLSKKRLQMLPLKLEQFYLIH